MGRFDGQLRSVPGIDKLPSEDLFQSLRDTGVPDNLSLLIMHAHEQGQALVSHGGKEVQTPLSRGVRQGDPLAPFLYACWSGRLSRQLKDALGSTFCQEHASFYADDKHLHWEILDETSLRRGLSQLATVISIIQQNGMQVSFKKCRAVFQLRGKKSRGN